LGPSRTWLACLLITDPAGFCASSPPCCLQAGMTIVPVGVDAKGNINIAELKQKAEQHK
jgi:glycine dehydrogenase